MRGTTVQIFLPSDEQKGIKIAFLTISNVQATLIPRPLLKNIDKYEELFGTGLYFLFGEGNQVYVGEAENINSRLYQHNREKDWWTHVIVITNNSINNPLTKTDVKYLEGLCFRELKDKGEFITEQTVPAIAKMSRFREADMQTIFKNIRMFTSILGYPLFNELDATTIKDEDMIFHIDKQGKSGRGIYSPEGFTLLKGAHVASEILSNNSSGSLQKAKDLIVQYAEQGLMILDDNGVTYVTLRDLNFESPSGAATFLLGHVSNGWVDWVNDDMKTLKQIYRGKK